jgi:Uma2 family endonuclease
MTPEEFDAIPPHRWDDRYRYELIRGVLVVSPFAGIAERGPNDYLGFLLWQYQETHPQGSALDATAPEQALFTTTNRRRCDRAIWTGLGRPPVEEKDVPSIAVEFVSASRRDVARDYEEKRDEYLAHGVREYWVIDRFRRIMTVYKPGPGGFVSRVVGEAESYQTELLPGFDLPLARLLAKADQWPRKRRRKPPARGAE